MQGLSLPLMLAAIFIIFCLITIFLIFYTSLSGRDQYNFDSTYSLPDVIESTLAISHVQKAPNYTPLENPYIEKQYASPEGQTYIPIATSAELISQVKRVNNTTQGNITFMIDDGIYTLGQTLNINKDYIKCEKDDIIKYLVYYKEELKRKL